MVGQVEPMSGNKTVSMLFSSLGGILKRLSDIVVAALGLLFLAPVFALIALWIKRDTPGSVFYRGRRVGRDSGIFDILKFRTMREERGSHRGPRITAQDDPRITPVGKWLRDTKLNELPQLWNVLRGEMSLVGPRPEDPVIVAEWPEAVRREVLSMRPGITSPASVLYRSEESLLRNDKVMETYLRSIVPNKLRLDQLYIRYHGFCLDLDVILWTFLLLLPRLRQYQLPEKLLFRGPISRFFSVYLSWYVIDVLLSFISIAVSVTTWRLFGPLNIGEPLTLVFAVSFAALFSICGVLFGVQKVDWSSARGEDALRLVLPTMLATALTLGINRLGLNGRAFPTFTLLFAAGLSFAGFVLARYRTRILREISLRFLRSRNAVAQAAGEHVLIVGGGEAGQIAARVLGNKQAFHVVGFVDDDYYKQDATIVNLPVVGRREDLAELVIEYDVGIVVFAIHSITWGERQALLKICSQTEAQVVIFPDFMKVLDKACETNGAHVEKCTVAIHPVMSAPGVAPAQVEQWLSDIDAALTEQGPNVARQQIAIFQAQLQHTNRCISEEVVI
jgi:lipopolysaccharide/colanic/teichoic acid biosynthesis glycosyltransferase